MPKCRVCGCENEDACYCEQPTRFGTCYWVEGDLCSACANLSLEDSFTWERWPGEVDLEREVLAAAMSEKGETRR